jgi:hypothetical protein
MLRLIKELGIEGAFDPETVDIMAAAFDRAWAAVQASGAPFSASDCAEGAREILGRAIIQATKAGERDAQKMSDCALLELARSERRPHSGGTHLHDSSVGTPTT